MLIKIRFVFTAWCFRLQNVIINQFHFNTFGGWGANNRTYFFCSPVDGLSTGRGELIIVSRGTYQNQFTVLASFSIILTVTGSPRPLCIFVSSPFHRLLKINNGVPQTINLPLRTRKGQFGSFLIHHLLLPTAKK